MDKQNTSDNKRNLDFQRLTELDIQLHFSGDFDHFFLSICHSPRFTKPFTRQEAEALKQKILSIIWFPQDQELVIDQ